MRRAGAQAPKIPRRSSSAQSSARAGMNSAPTSCSGIWPGRAVLRQRRDWGGCSRCRDPLSPSLCPAQLSGRGHRSAANIWLLSARSQHKIQLDAHPSSWMGEVRGQPLPTSAGICSALSDCKTPCPEPSGRLEEFLLRQNNSGGTGACTFGDVLAETGQLGRGYGQ